MLAYVDVYGNALGDDIRDLYMLDQLRPHLDIVTACVVRRPQRDARDTPVSQEPRRKSDQASEQVPPASL
eukprot:scaffold20508_cov10-Prasinocladus_malaysianus.AAC.1